MIRPEEQNETKEKILHFSFLAWGVRRGAVRRWRTFSADRSEAETTGFRLAEYPKGQSAFWYIILRQESSFLCTGTPPFSQILHEQAADRIEYRKDHNAYVCENCQIHIGNTKCS